MVPATNPSSRSLIMAKSKAHTFFTLVSRALRPKAKAAETRHTDTTLRRPPLEYQKSSKIVQLPEDVLLIIADHLRLADRGRLLRTCRYFHSLLEVIQYRHLDVSEEWLLFRTDRLYRTLSERPDLIPCLISYRGPLTPIIFSLPPKKKSEKNKSLLRKSTKAPLSNSNLVIETEPFRRAMSIFPKAVNLRELEFTDCTDWTSDPSWEPVRTAISKMSLTRLSLRTSSESSEVVPQLQAQPGLERLELSWIPARLWGLKETDIPKLKSLSATLQNAATIVPGRPVEELHLTLGLREYVLDEQLVQKLSLSSVPITKLVTSLRCSWVHDEVRSKLQVLARHLPQLRHLTLTVAGFISGQILLDEIPSFRFLCSVKFLDASLRPTCRPDYNAGYDPFGAQAGLANSGDDGIAARIPAIDDWEDLLQRLREKCPSLVDIEYTQKPLCCCWTIQTLC